MISLRQFLALVLSSAIVLVTIPRESMASAAVQPTAQHAVQVMRKRAQSAGTLKTTAQETVTTKDQTVIIEPANPEIVYLPEYDPWIVYGAPLLAYPGYFDEGFFVGPFIFFDAGFPIRR